LLQVFMKRGSFPWDNPLNWPDLPREYLLNSLESMTSRSLTIHHLTCQETLKMPKVVISDTSCLIILTKGRDKKEVVHHT
jgi:hypothetical protein